MERKPTQDPLVMEGSLRRDEFADLRVNDKNLVTLLTEHFGPFQVRARDDALPGDNYRITVERIEKPDDPWRWFTIGALEAVHDLLQDESYSREDARTKIAEIQASLVSDDLTEDTDIVARHREQIEALVHQVEYEYLSKIPQGDMDDYSAPVRDARHNLAIIRQVLSGSTGDPEADVQ